MSGKLTALILAGGAGTRLDILSLHRAKPATPFAGKYRIIDFVLSNCINSDIYTVGVLTQYLPRSLSEHIGVGKPWDLDRSFGGVTILPPYQRKGGQWYLGTANAVYQNLNYVSDTNADNVIILAGDHVYKMDYRKMLKRHLETNADLTIAVKEVENSLASQFGIIEVDDDDMVKDFVEKPKKPISNLASMGIYIFKYNVLKEILLRNCGPHGSSDFGKDIIPLMLNKFKISAYRFNNYWRDVGTLDQYWKANLELINQTTPLDLYDEEFRVYTKSEDLPPVKFVGKGSAKNSLISNGCVVKGYVENSVISPGVIIEEDVIIKNSIVLNRSLIRKGSMIDKTIIDKDVIVGENCKIGCGEADVKNIEHPDKLSNGLNLIGKFAVIPSHTIIKRNSRIMSKVQTEDFMDVLEPETGATIHSSREGGFFNFYLD